MIKWFYSFLIRATNIDTLYSSLDWIDGKNIQDSHERSAKGTP